MLRHTGHKLPNGETGLPHFQTDGKFGHAFWGKLDIGAGLAAIGAAAGAIKDFIVDVATDPSTYYAPLALLKPGTLGNGDVYGPGKQYQTRAEYENSFNRGLTTNSTCQR
jgi:hypothetical protein